MVKLIKCNHTIKEKFSAETSENYTLEMSRVISNRNTRPNFCIYVHPDKHRKGEEYFKVFNSASFDSADKVCRISFRRPEYIIHTNSDGKINFKLNNEFRKEVIKILNTIRPVKINDNQITVWQWAILQYNNERGLDYEDTMQNLSYDKNGNPIPPDKLKYPEDLPFDLQMPDYTKLQ